MLLPEQAVILLVDDREDDVLLVRRALSRANVPNPLFVVRDGEEAMAYLDGVGKYSNRDEYPLPDIMLLDIKMPKMDGFDVLREVRSRAEFKAMRIIVLTSSEDIFDVNKAYDLGANSFLVKPLEFENYTAMMRTLSAFWLHQSKNPTIERPPKKSHRNGRDGDEPKK
jgi:CheY-like chemotaxis protein